MLNTIKLESVPRYVAKFVYFLFIISFLCPNAAWGGSACFSNKTGEWSSPSTWTSCGGRVPGRGDTATINASHTVTVDTPLEIGTSPPSNGTPAIVLNGNLNILPEKTLTIRGPVVSGNAIVNVAHGATIEFDASESQNPLLQKYSWTTSNKPRDTCVITCAGTQSKHVVIKSNPGGGNGFFGGGASLAKLNFNCMYTDFIGIGDASNSAIVIDSDSTKPIVKFKHSSFDSKSGAIELKDSQKVGVQFIIEDSRFLQVNSRQRGNGYKSPLVLPSAPTDSHGNLQRLYRCSFVKAPSLGGSFLDIHDCVFLEGWGIVYKSGKWMSNDGSFVRINVNNGIISSGDLSNSFVLFDSDFNHLSTGFASQASSLTLTDTTKSWNFPPSGHYSVEIVEGRGVGQRRAISSHNSNSISVPYPWDQIPDNTSKYVIFIDIYNNHGITPWRELTSGTITMDGVVWQNTGTDSQGDCNLHQAFGPKYVIKNNIVLPNSMGESSGTLVTLGGNAYSPPNGYPGPFVIEHNTAFAGAQSAVAICEGGVNQTGTIHSFQSNIIWQQPGRKYWSHGGATPGYKVSSVSGGRKCDAINIEPVDIISEDKADYNAGFGLLKSCTGSKSYNYHFSKVPGAHDKDGDPDFADPTRSFWSWAVAMGSKSNSISGQVSDGLRYLVDNPALTRTSLIPYIRSGFRPRNMLLKGAAHDGGDIGAVPLAGESYFN